METKDLFDRNAKDAVKVYQKHGDASDPCMGYIYIHIYIYIYVYMCLHSVDLYGIYIPRAQITSIFEGQPSKTRPFPIKSRVIWVLGIYIYMPTFSCFLWVNIAYMDPMGDQRDMEKKGKIGDSDIAHTIHGTGIFTYILQLP